MKKTAFILALLTALYAAPSQAADQKTLVVFGDSLVAGYGLKKEESLPEQIQARLTKEKLPIKVYGAGVSGDTTAGGLNRIDYALRLNPDYIMIVLGGNDMLRGIDPVVTRENLRRMLEKLKDKNVPVLLAGMRAMGAGAERVDIAYIKMYQTLAKQYNAVLYPFILQDVALKAELNQRDGVHPTAEGVAIIVNNLMPYLAELFVRTGGEGSGQQEE